ncbi:MAG: FecR family protein [Sterolibacterium sp.]
MRGFGCLLILAACLGAPAYAANRSVSQATVETVQMPAWLERNGRTQPLAVGMEVQNGDHIRTGVDARAYLKLAEGSTVKLGENATLNFYSRSLKPERMFKGALDVLKGAFRFTTSALQRARSQRDLAIRVGTATAGIRGTDVWGKSDAERDLILLIEGKIEIRHAESTLELDEPLVYFAAPRNAATQLRPVDPDDFRQWARETEILPGDGAMQRGGSWHVLLARVASQRGALEVYDTARQAGYAAQIKVLAALDGKLEKGGQWEYEVVLTQLPSQQEAAAVAKKIKAQLGFEAIPVK